MKGWTALLVPAALVVGFALGRSGVPAPVAALSVSTAGAPASMWRPVADRSTDEPQPGDQSPRDPQSQSGNPQSGASPSGSGNDPRELIPLVPGTGRQPGPGQQPGQQPGQAPGECTVLMFRDGQFYRMQPGPGPGPGGPGDDPGGTPGGDRELFPLQPQPSPTPDPFSGPEMRT